MTHTNDDRTQPSPEDLVNKLHQLLDVQPIEEDLYLGEKSNRAQSRVFGGQVVAQALMAASKSTDSQRRAHSLHAYFMRQGDDSQPIHYRVERDFEGRSFATRRVIALQNDKPILNLAASFHLPETGPSHQHNPMPDVAPPEALLTDREYAEANADRLPEAVIKMLSRRSAIEFKRFPQGFPLSDTPRDGLQMTWFRTPSTFNADPGMHRSALAFASDFGLLSTCMLPHGINWITPGLQSASLDHALWFHEEFRIDDWLLYVMDSPWSGHARGFNRGAIYSRDGRLIASATQEGLLRLRST